MKQAESSHLQVQVVVKVLVNLLGIAVLLQQAAQNAHAADPEDLYRQASLPGTVALACETRIQT